MVVMQASEVDTALVQWATLGIFTHLIALKLVCRVELQACLPRVYG